MRALYLSILFFIGSGVAFSGSNPSVYNLVEKISRRHLVYNEVNPEMTKRAIRLFVHQFDPKGIYLEEEEKDRLMECDDALALRVTQDLKRGDLSLFESHYRFFQTAIKRSKQIRMQPDLHNLSVSRELSTQIFSHRDWFYSRYSKLLTEASPEERLAYYNKKLSSHENKYTQEVGFGAFSTLVVKAYAKSLDPHTNFYSDIEAKEIKTYYDKGIQGIGISFKEKFDGIEVGSLMPSGPAKRSQKVHPGDYLLCVGGQRVDHLEFSEALRYLLLSPQKVNLLFAKGGPEGDQYEVVLEKEPIVIESERLDLSYDHYQDGVIGKLTLHGFYDSSNASSDRDIKRALRALREIAPIKGLILDLRYNPGGLLSQAPRVAGCFMKSGVVATWKLAGEQKRILREIDGSSYYEGPLVVLTSKASASCAEIVTGALQDYGLCVVVGDSQTYGKGTVQDQNATLGQTPAYRVTFARYYTVSGHSPQLEGIGSDIVVPSPYHHTKIGEQYLHYALRPNTEDAMFLDALFDIPQRKKRWYQKHYLPKVQKKQNFWDEHLPKLRASSKKRLKENLLMQEFCSTKVYPTKVDIQMDEAINILKDMIALYEQHDGQS